MDNMYIYVVKLSHMDIKSCNECGAQTKRDDGLCFPCSRKGSRNPAWKDGRSKDHYHAYKVDLCACGNQKAKISKTCKKCWSKRIFGDNNPNWVGDDVCMSGLHLWVSAHKPKPELCEKCNVRPSLDLANKGKYARGFENWEWLCRKCHMESDGRLEKFMRSRDGLRMKKEG